jgi:hypothetical protein
LGEGKKGAIGNGGRGGDTAMIAELQKRLADLEVRIVGLRGYL